MRNIFISLFFLALVFFLWPYIAVFNLYVQLKTSNMARVKMCVDWSSFERNMQANIDNLLRAKLKESLNKEEISYSFDSMIASKQIVSKVATPQGLIYLFNQPDEFIQQIRQIFTNTLLAENINIPASKKKTLKPEGPNFQDLFERIKYVFFTEPEEFRLIFNEAGLSFTMDWQLQGLFWKLARLKIPAKIIQS